MSAPHRPSRGVQWGLEGVTVSAVRAWAPLVAPVSALLGLLGGIAVILAALAVDHVPDPASVEQLSLAQAHDCFEGIRTRRCARLLAIDREILPDFRTYAAMRLPNLPRPPPPRPAGMVFCGNTDLGDSAFEISANLRPEPGWNPPEDRLRRLKLDWAETQENPWLLAFRTGATAREWREERARVASEGDQAMLRLGITGLLGTLAFFGAFAIWLVPRRSELHIGVHGVRIDGRNHPISTITGLRRVGSRLVLETADGPVRSPALLAPALLDDALEALARLPAPDPGDSPDADRLRSLLARANPVARTPRDTRPPTPDTATLDNRRESDLH